MVEEKPAEIFVKRVVHGPKWKVVRLLTKIWEFPEYMVNVKQAKVLSKQHNIWRTEWLIKVEKVLITWIQEDKLELRRNKITFCLVEGDLKEFSGQWQFNDHPDGTEVTLTVAAKVGIPAIHSFASNYIKDLMTKNFEGILEAIDERIIAARYSEFKKGSIDAVSGFAVIGHFYNLYHLEKCFKMLHPDFKMPSQAFLSSLFHTTPPFKLHDINDFKSKTGETANGRFIVATFIPEMVEQDIWTVFSKVVKSCKIAEQFGVGIVSLGGFTSIVGERIGQEIKDQVNVAVTTGNTFTAAMVVDGVFKAVSLLDRDISKLKMTIVGGTGDIGSACARVFAEKVLKLTVTGRTKKNLSKIKKELSKIKKSKIEATMDNESAVKEADIVIAAAGVSSSILNIDWFKAGSIVCDVGYPKNVSYSSAYRDDILVFSAGLSKIPSTMDFPIDIGLPSNEITYGCFAEAMILSLEKRYESFSFGRGNIYPEKIEEIRSLGEKHGFTVSPFYWADRLLDEQFLNILKEKMYV